MSIEMHKLYDLITFKTETLPVPAPEIFSRGGTEFRSIRI
jgi:hypothetical protein